MPVVGDKTGGKPFASGDASPLIRTAYEEVFVLPAGAAVLGDVTLAARLVTETKMRTPAGTLLKVAFRRVP
jgi:hypothetical protein